MVYSDFTCVTCSGVGDLGTHILRKQSVLIYSLVASEFVKVLLLKQGWQI